MRSSMLARTSTRKESESGQTPLIFAASTGQVATIKALLKRGADPKIATKVVDLSKQSALDRQALALRRQILAATVPQGEQPTPRARAGGDSGDARAARRPAERPRRRPRRPRRELVAVAVRRRRSASC